ncbi:MAG: hypothetical protein R2681_08930 [Pyrinomonadaceae bacterium]
MADSFSGTEKILAWSVHVFSASGLIAGFMAILAIADKNFRAAMAWLLLCLFIDGVDGTLARRFRVKEILPNVDGSNIDYVVDFTTYAVIPAYFFFAAELVDPNINLPLAFLILLVSAVYYGIKGMVSEDFYFVGFPVMWNVVVFYLFFIFAFPGWVNAAIIVILAVLHFVPIKFAYPSRATRFRKLTAVFSILLMVIMPLAVWLYPAVPVWLKILAALNLAYFAVLAVIDTLRSPQS